METLAILVAAGRGERMGGDRPKAFLDLAGQPLLYRTARAFDQAPSVSGVVAVVPAGLEADARAMLLPLSKFRAAVRGGARRQDSVLEGLKQVPAGFDGLVLVHDVARPFVGNETALPEAPGHGAKALPLFHFEEYAPGRTFPRCPTPKWSTG